ncbi:hypothetical protein [Gordonia sp. NPDC058843]|uniref:hypothetical protein n=1 Tax=Gordonia sp. NPDC058843 TaxID=3346648 RepID=UPI0036AC55BD
MIKNTSTSLDSGPELRRHEPTRSGATPLLRAWTEAVESGGRGDYARALTGLTALERRIRPPSAPSARPGPDVALLSLCQSTRASLMRQAGRHRIAHGIDGRSLLTVGLPDDRASTVRATHDAVEVSLSRAAIADGLIGLAADNLGLLRFGAARRLLDRARSVLDRAAGSSPGAARDGWSWRPAEADWATATRCRLRWEWVSAELGLYRGDVATGLEHARSGALLIREMDDAGTPVPPRHRIKTELIAGAATAGSGDLNGAATVARDVAADARDHGLLPLEWAATSLLLGTGAASEDDAARHRRLRATLIGKGMALLPEG